MREPSVGYGEATNYFEEIRRFPMLKADEEHMLAVRSHERGDAMAVQQLLTSHLRLVARIAMGYGGYGLPASDLISEGNIGLMRAVKRFDPDRGARFSTYATWWIKAAIQSYILRSWSLVKLGTTRNQKKLFFHLPRAKRRLSALQEGDLRPDQVTAIATELGVSEHDVVEMNRRLSGDLSLNARLDGADNSVEWQERLIDDCPDQETRLVESEDSEIRQKALRVALKVLDSRERRVLEGRRLANPPLTLDDLANEFHISRERVRQIEARAFQRVQRAAQMACTRRGRNDYFVRSHSNAHYPAHAQ